MVNIFDVIEREQLIQRRNEISQQESIINYKKFVCFHLNGREYGIDIEYVQEIIEVGYIRKIIYMPQFLLGVLNLRGAIIAVIDLKQLFHLGQTDLKNEKARLIISKFENKSLGFIVDSIAKIREIAPTDIQQAPATFNEINSNYVLGMYRTPENNLLVMLNYAEIFNCPEIKALSTEEQNG